MDNNQFENQIPEKIYTEGRMFYRKGGVSNLEIMPFFSNKIWCDRLTADVMGNDWREYLAVVTVEKESGHIAGVQCNCGQYQKTKEICPHCVAAILRYQEVTQEIKKRQDNPLPRMRVDLTENRKPEEHEKTTDAALMEIFAKENVAFRNRFRSQGMREVELYPEISFHTGVTPAVSFEIGRQGGRKYVLQSMTEFSILMDTGGFHRYGRDLEITHDLSQFTPQGAGFAAFIMEMVRDERQRSESDSRFFYRNDTRIKRSISLTGNRLDHLMKLVTEAGGAVIAYEDAESGVRFRQYAEAVMEEPRLKLEICVSGSGVQIRDCSRGMLFDGAQFEYLVTPELICMFPMENMAQIRRFRDYLLGRAKGTYVGRKELSFLVRKLIPLLQEHYDIEIRDFDVQEYEPAEVTFRFYLDAPQRDVITARCSAVYGEEIYSLYAPEQNTAERDEEKEWQALSAVRSFFEHYDMQADLFTIREDNDLIYRFLSEGIPCLQDLGEVYISDALKKMQIRQPSHFSAGVSIRSDLLQFDISSEDMAPQELAEILSRYDRKKKYFRLKNGEFVSMEDDGIRSVVSALDDLHITGREILGGSVTIPRYRAMYLDALAADGGLTSFTRDRSFRELVRNMKSVDESDYEVPASLSGIMRGYQKTGFMWLRTLSHNGFGGILADDMGLGKTLQIIAFLLSEQEEAAAGDNRRSLIICPASLVYNWKNEISRFAPLLQVQMVTGTAAERSRMIRESTDRDILITSIDLVKRDIDAYENITFFSEIIDEAQFIKNQTTQAARSVKQIHALTRFALTGTPVENRLSELWSIFDYLMPGFLMSYRQFREKLEIPIVEEQDEEVVEKLRRFIAPFVLRRLKKDVLRDLPDKMEEVIYVQLQGEQNRVYRAEVQKLRQRLAKRDTDFNRDRIEILAALTRLRQLCCSPELILENYHGDSAKTDQCMDMLRDAAGSGHKVLVFSQFTSMLDILTKKAQAEQIRYHLLTGATSKEERAQMVQEFETDDTQVFFISLKAGGTGLNLTAADIVIHYDPWWNLAAQNQATDRTHRIGQKNVVTVYKLIAKDTIEDRILELQGKKAQLADQVLGGEEIGRASFTRQELMEILED